MEVLRGRRNGILLKYCEIELKYCEIELHIVRLTCWESLFFLEIWARGQRRHPLGLGLFPDWLGGLGCFGELFNYPQYHTTSAAREESHH